jgi:hypothetical protein
VPEAEGLINTHGSAWPPNRGDTRAKAHIKAQAAPNAQCVFLPVGRIPRHGELGLDAPLKLVTSLAPRNSDAFGDWE